MLNAAKISDLVEGSFWEIGSVSENREIPPAMKGLEIRRKLISFPFGGIFYD